MQEWNEEGTVLGTRRHGESSVILEVMTRGHGRHLGYAKGGAGKRARPVLQPGNRLDLTWGARLDDHLGWFRFETARSRSFEIISDHARMLCLGVASEHLRLLPERQADPGLHDAFEILLDLGTDRPSILNLLVRFELQVLSSIGLGLDLASCAATGATDDLAYVSPKTGRAVGREAGAPWAERMLPLPGFLATSLSSPTDEALGDALRLTGFFLERRAYEPRGRAMPEARERLVGPDRKADAA